MVRKLSFDIPEKLRFLNETQSRYKICYGGRGSGKSWSVARAIIARCVSRKTRVLCAREFQKSIKESVHQLLSDQIHLLGLDDLFQIMATEIRGTNGSQIVYCGLHDNTADSLKSFEGVNLCWIEEAQTITKRSLQILKPTIREPFSEIWFTMNPENEEDPVYSQYVLQPQEGCIAVKVNWYDNPWFDKVLMDEKNADFANDPESADWIWNGNCRRISDAQVLKGKCITEPFSPNPELWDGPYQGLDFGFATDPSAFIRCWVWEGRLYIDQEAYGEHVEIEDTPALLDCVPHARDYPIRADAARPEMISYLRRNGFTRIVSCKKWPGSVEDRISFLKSFDRIVIHPRCPKIAREGKLWKYKTDKSGEVMPVLLPGNDHGWDAVGYALEPHILGHAKKNPRQVEFDSFESYLNRASQHNASWMR